MKKMNADDMWCFWAAMSAMAFLVLVVLLMR